MTDEPETTEDHGARTPRRYSRRRVLGTAGGAAAVAAVAFAGGVALVQGAGATPTLQPGQRRRFVGKVVLITGATSGIGRAAAIRFAAEGGKVAFCGRRRNLGRAVQEEIRAAGHEATYIHADVRDEHSVRAFVDAAVRRYGGLDVCFNNAGITIQKPLHEYTAAQWDDVLGTDLRGNFLALKYEIPHLIDRGAGVVVVTSSSNALTTTGGKAAYTAAKCGILGLVDCAAFDYARHNIRVNALVPGTTDTDLVRRAAGTEGLPDPVWETMARIYGKSNVPAMRRMASPDEIALGALALACDDFPYMTASRMVLDGGVSAYS
ncbi:short-chain dehydrogenase [Actinocatenispora thailandica]|uniref:Short-chain dehydrogenase n=1 Tax=Actinocatenispora thailandica TaxID=227318 RepID=A0A7R7DLN0_9ACTN|nr:SDR family NAD(P)-dependent oxidoreductase [Actinocatenispora thailandica]BCJ33985.1 short-chain dehydrogenase [Actinocatenispora thailandica]